MTKLLTAALAALFLAAGAAHALGTERYTLTVGNQGAGGDPGVLYVGGPANFRVRDRTGAQRPVEVCITPAPIDQPSCRHSHTNRTLSGPAFSAAGDTKIRFSVAGGPPIERTVVVASNATAQKSAGPYRIRAAAAIYRGRYASVVVRLNRALPKNGEDRPPLMLAGGLVRDEILPRGQRYYGGITPGRVGARARHCYVAEAQQLVPRTTLRDGARMSVAIRSGHRIVAVSETVLHRGLDAFTPAFLQRAGC